MQYLASPRAWFEFLGSSVRSAEDSVVELASGMWLSCIAAGYTARMQPSQIGPYRIVSRLGRGGMGAVYEAEDQVSGQAVALKLLAAHLADDPGLRKRFNAEIETLKSLRHPGIVHLIAFGEDDGQPYFAMQLVRGRSLEQILRSGHRFSWQETVATALTVTRALKVAHDHGVIHRDLKPANLLIPRSPADPADSRVEPADSEIGNPADIRLADFGIAKLFGGGSHTAHGNIVGTAEYMAPEQAAGKPVDHRVDLYALGLVMYAMLTGRPPFIGRQVTEIIERQRHETAARVSTIVPEVPAELDSLIDRLLAKDPAQRPANALALGRLLSAIDLDRPKAEAAAAKPPAPADIAHEPTRHDRGLQTVAATAATTDQPRPDAVDLMAPTQAQTPAGTVALTEACSGPSAAERAARPGSGRAAADTATSAVTLVDHAKRNRFTTVEELEATAKQTAARHAAMQRRWQAVAAAVTVAALAGAGWLIFARETADQLYDRIKVVEAAASAGGDLRDVRPLVGRFLASHADDPRADEIRDIDRRLDLDALEKRARRRVLGDRQLSPIERDYRAAMDREAESPTACREALLALVRLHPSPAGRKKPAADAAESLVEDESLWVALAQRQIDRLGPLAAREQSEDDERIAGIFKRADALDRQARMTTDARRTTAMAAERRTLLQGIIDLYGNRPHAAQAVETARRKMADENWPNRPAE